MLDRGRVPARQEACDAVSWTVYLAECADGSLYCGITNDIERRLRAHNAGTGARYTRSRRPVQFVWTEPHETRGSALSRERCIKATTRAQKLDMVRSIHADAGMQEP